MCARNSCSQKKSRIPSVVRKRPKQNWAQATFLSGICLKLPFLISLSNDPPCLSILQLTFWPPLGALLHSSREKSKVCHALLITIWCAMLRTFLCNRLIKLPTRSLRLASRRALPADWIGGGSSSRSPGASVVNKLCVHPQINTKLTEAVWTRRFAKR